MIEVEMFRLKTVIVTYECGCERMMFDFEGTCASDRCEAHGAKVKSSEHRSDEV